MWSFVPKTKSSGGKKRRRPNHIRDFELERRKHVLLLVIKLLHELQHILTWLLFNMFSVVSSSALPQPTSPAQSGEVHAS